MLYSTAAPGRGGPEPQRRRPRPDRPPGLHDPQGGRADDLLYDIRTACMLGQLLGAAAAPARCSCPPPGARIAALCSATSSPLRRGHHRRLNEIDAHRDTWALSADETPTALTPPNRHHRWSTHIRRNSPMLRLPRPRRRVPQGSPHCVRQPLKQQFVMSSQLANFVLTVEVAVVLKPQKRLFDSMNNIENQI